MTGEQSELFVEPDDLAAEAVERVEAGNLAWIDGVGLPLLALLCRRRSQLTTDHFWKELDRRHLPVPDEPRALGAVMRRAKARGWIEHTGQYAPSTRPDCNGRPIPRWRVLLAPSKRFLTPE